MGMLFICVKATVTLVFHRPARPDLYLILRGKARAKTELKTPKARHEPGVDEQLPGADVDDTTASCEGIPLHWHRLHL